MRGGAFLNGKEGRVGFRTNSTEYGGYIPNPYGRDLGLGYRGKDPPAGVSVPYKGNRSGRKDHWTEEFEQKYDIARRSTISIFY